MKMKTVKTLASAFLICLSIGSLGAMQTTETVTKRIEMKVMPEELTQILEERAKELEELPPIKSEELIKESYELYPYDFSRHFVEKMGYQGQSIELNDGSVWVVKPHDAYRVQDWPDASSAYYYGIPQAKVCITTNNSWFSNRDYEFMIMNLETGEQVPAKMSVAQRPEVQGFISRFFDTVNQIELGDPEGNFLAIRVNSWDQDITRYWNEGDRIYLGRNNRWDHGRFPYILINLDQNFSYVRAAL